MARRWGGLGTGISFIHEITEQLPSFRRGFFRLPSCLSLGLLSFLCLDDPDDGFPRHDVRGRLLLHDLVGEVVGPRLEVVPPRHDVLGRVRERDLELDGVDDGFDLLSGTPLAAILGLE